MAVSKGQPRAFKDSKEFEEKFITYIQHCKDIDYLSNVAGFCRFCRITRETFYKQKEYYSDTFNIIQLILEDEGINNKTIGDSFKKYYMANKFNWTDNRDIRLDDKRPIQIINDLPNEV